jgi:hypothetical protein
MDSGKINAEVIKAAKKLNEFDCLPAVDTFGVGTVFD